MTTPRHIFITLCVALFALTGAVSSAQALPDAGFVAQALPNTSSADKLKPQLDALLSQRRGVVQQLRALETRYEALATRIDELKRAGARGGLQRAELESQLRQGRELSQQLSALQQRIQALDDALAKQRALLLSALDADRRALEARLASASRAQRGSLVQALNALSRERARYATPQPQLDLARLERLMRLADAADDPDDMVAMADEIQDAESVILRQLAQVSEHLDELRARKRLLRRARAFGKQESFFDERDRNRVIARVVTSNPPVTEAGGNPPTSGNDRGEHNAGEPPLDNEQPPTNNAPPAEGEPDLSPGVPGPPDRPNHPGSGFEQPAPDPLAPPSSALVLSREADPDTSHARAGRPDDRAIDHNIARLEADQRLLKKQAEALRQRAERLRQRAAQPER